MAGSSRYAAIIEAVFHGLYEAGTDSVDFQRDEIVKAALSLGIEPPKNLGDVIYAYRYRQELPAIPVQAKSGSNKIGRVQIEQDIAVCRHKLPSLICRPIGAYLMEDDLVALLEYEQHESEMRVVSEGHYRLVPP